MNEELNKKLAEWAGFEGIIYLNTSGGEAGRHWSAPDKQRGGPTLPDFTSSLDACFKWLVPKAIREFGELKTRWMLKDWINSISTDIEYSLPIASSLCVAIEKLIDAEEV